MGQIHFLVGTICDAMSQEAPPEVVEDQVALSTHLVGLTQMTSAIAHEFNNLLLGIIACIDLVYEDLSPADENREHLEYALNTADLQV